MAWTQEALACLEHLASSAALTADLAVLLEGQQLAAGLASGQVRDGAKLPLLPLLVPPAPLPAPSAAPAAAPPRKSGFASGFLSSPAAKQQQQQQAHAEQQQQPRDAAGNGRQKREAAAAPVGEDAARAAGPATSPSPSSSSETTQQGAPAGPHPLSLAAPIAGQTAGPSAALDPLHQLVARSDAARGEWRWGALGWVGGSWAVLGGAPWGGVSSV